MSDEIRWVKTHCARMDHGGYALTVGVKGNQIEKIKGDPTGYLNKGYICPKALAANSSGNRQRPGLDLFNGHLRQPGYSRGQYSGQ